MSGAYGMRFGESERTASSVDPKEDPPAAAGILRWSVECAPVTVSRGLCPSVGFELEAVNAEFR